MDLVAEFARVIEALESAGVEYAVCGGLAVALHGHVRATRDIDLLIPAAQRDRAVATLRAKDFTLQAGPIPFAVGTPKERTLYRVSKVEGTELLTVDLLLVTPVFEDVWSGRQAFSWQGHRVIAVSLAGLGKMKRLAHRAQDLADLESLGLPASWKEDG
jgi:hypothetical protein